MKHPKPASAEEIAQAWADGCGVNVALWEQAHPGAQALMRIAFRAAEARDAPMLAAAKGLEADNAALRALVAQLVESLVDFDRMGGTYGYGLSTEPRAQELLRVTLERTSKALAAAKAMMKEENSNE
jgi:hypothetical protein